MNRIAKVFAAVLFATLLVYGAIMVSECRSRDREMLLFQESALRRQTLEGLWNAIESHRKDHNRWPLNNEELVAGISELAELDELRHILLHYRVHYDRLGQGRVQVLVDDPGYTIAYRDVGPWRLCLLTDGRIVSFDAAQQFR